MKATTHTINGVEIKKEFITMEDSYRDKLKGQVFSRKNKTQILIDGQLLVTLSGWNTLEGSDLLKHLERVNAYNSKTQKFNI